MIRRPTSLSLSLPPGKRDSIPLLTRRGKPRLSRENDQEGTQVGTGRSVVRGTRAGGHHPDACPAARWTERKRSCFQNRSPSPSPSLRKPSEWPWSPRRPPSSTAIQGPPEVTPCPQRHPGQGPEEGLCERDSGLRVGCSLHLEHFLPFSSQFPPLFHFGSLISPGS